MLLENGSWVPERTCVACRKKGGKGAFLRVARSGGAYLIADEGGRGAYVCRAEACVKKTVERHLLDKAFREKVPAEVYEMLRMAT